MELVLIVTFAALIGGALRYVIPGRDRHGLVLLPAFTVAIAAILWSSAVWLGLGPSTVWPWLVALLPAAIATIWLGIVLPKQRDREDEQLFAELTAPGRTQAQA